MIVSMQGNWTVTVKARHAAYPQRFVIAGADSGNGVHSGSPGTSVTVTGDQWTIAIQHDPGTGFQLSDTQLQYPTRSGGDIVFDVRSNDSGSDEDFNDLVLTCSTPETINDFIVYGRVQMYSGTCLFNPCRRPMLVIETPDALHRALRNSRLREILERLYPERVPPPPLPDPPDPGPFKPIVIDLFNEATKPGTALRYRRSPDAGNNTTKKAGKQGEAKTEPVYAVGRYTLEETFAARGTTTLAPDRTAVAEITRIVDELLPLRCRVEPADNITLTFEEYDRTTAELAGAPYTGSGHRQLLGDTITDMNGNYIFRFSFDMTFPGLAETTDIAPGEDISVVAYPDLIVKVTAYAPSNVLYESAPHYNIPNLKRLDLCLPRSVVVPTSTCYNGSLLGSIGNVFIGGNQNASASFTASALRRYGYGNHLEANGVISVHNSQAGFSAECAAWTGLLDLKGCMYDTAKDAADNSITHYTLRIRRMGTSRWEFVSQNYKHPRYHKRNLPNYTGDDVGPFTMPLKVDGGPAVDVPAYINIQRRVFADGEDWEFSSLDRFMQLNTRLYDMLGGEHTPGTFYLRMDGYDANGDPVPGATDLIALFVHNRPLTFELHTPTLLNSAIVQGGCGLYRLTDAQLGTAMELPFRVSDPYGFVDSYTLSMHRCPAPMLALDVQQPPSLPDTATGASVLVDGAAAGNVQAAGCPGYGGTLTDFSSAGMIDLRFRPHPSAGGWIRSGEYFTVYDFSLTARLRITNGYNRGVSSLYDAYRRIMMERIGP